MGMFSKPKAPPPLDVNKVAGAQNAQNQQNIQQQATYNRPNQYGPFGSVTWQQNPDGSFSQTTSIDPNELAYRERLKGIGEQGLTAGLSALGNQPSVGRVASDPQGLMGLGTASLYGLSSTPFAAPDWQDAADRATQYMRLTQGEQRDALDNKLRNQGLQPGTEAYDRAMRDQKVAADLAVGQATQGVQGQLYNQALGTRGQNWGEATGLFGLGQSEAQRLFGEDLSGAGLDLNRASTLANLSRGVMPSAITSPQVSSFSGINVPNVDLTSLYQQQQNDLWKQYGANMQNYNNMWNTFGNLAGTVAGFGMPGGGTLGGNLMGQGLAGLGWGLGF